MSLEIEIKDKEMWDKNLLLAYKWLFRNFNKIVFPSFSAYKKILELCKDNHYSAYEISQFTNQVFPSPSNTVFSEFISNNITDILRKNNVLNGLEGYFLNNGISDYNSFNRELDNWEKILLEKRLSVSDIRDVHNKKYDTKPIKVDGYNLFFHGTPKENFHNIENDGYLMYQTYEPDIRYEFISQILEFDKNRLYLSDSFDDSIYYALRKSLDGYVIAINMEDCVLYNSHISTHHFWTTEKILKDRFVKIYHIYVENNQIKISENKAVSL